MSFLQEVGERYQDFVLTKIVPLPELNCCLRELTHTPSQACVMHIDNDDPENLFCLSFRTLPSSSDGVAHVLEHTVLCGSKKFPVKDPFFAMGRRSLNTFMNALTGSDFTCYPAASLNEKDFYNLLEVYLDAVFHPELKEMSFLQEGHRLELANPKDPQSPLEYKGIVFNEMKGSLNSVDTRLWHAMMQELYPNLPYAFNSGGDPKEIPNLTYSDLIAFHETYYHPSRCLFFFYGNLPLKQHLDFLVEQELKHVRAAPPLPLLPLQKRFSHVIYKRLSYPVHGEEPLVDRGVLGIGFLTAPLINQEEVLALSLLDSILMETDASLLKKPLLQSKFCAQVDASMDIEMSEVPYVITFKGCQEGKMGALGALFRETLEEICEQGIAPDLIDAALHQLELARSEITGDQAPFGLTLFLRSALAKQQGCPPENGLAIHSLFQELLRKVKDPTYLTGLIRRHLLDNPHSAHIEMMPDPALSAEESAAEKAALSEIKRHLTEEQLDGLRVQAKQLARFQKLAEGQSLECLPKVTLEDVSPVARSFALKEEKREGLKIFHHPCFTNGILYADIVCDLSVIAEEDLPLVPLCTTLLTEIGSGDRSYADKLSYLQAYTGGISAACALHIQVPDPTLARPALHLKGKALDRNADRLLGVLEETLLSPRFEEQGRVEELILQIRSAQLGRFSRNAMRYASHLALSGFSSAAHIQEAWMGLRYFKTIEAITEDLPSRLPLLLEQLTRLSHQLISLHDPHLVISGSKEGLTLPAFAAKGGFQPWTLGHTPSPCPSHARVIASPVAFTAKAFKTVPLIHPHAPALTIASQLFDHKFLHPLIREQGGAYGCGATYHSGLGIFSFYAFRDPNLASTLHAFEESIEKIASNHFDVRDLEEAKLSIVQHLDSPVAPGSRAGTAYAWRRSQSESMRQEFRERLLALSPKEVARAVEAELLPQKDKGVTVCFAGKELLEKENKRLIASGRKALEILPI